MNLLSHREPLARRTLLRGLGASVALPWLEAMRPARAAESTARPLRMAFFYMPNGVNVDRWTPKTGAGGLELSPTLQPLEAHKDRLLVLQNLYNKSALGGDGHYVKTAGLLTSTTITKTTGADLRSGGTSVDQLYARHVGASTKLPSLELGIDPITTGVDSNVGYTRLYGSHIAWRGSTTPLPAEIQPRLAFNRIFRDGGSLHANRSVLDLVAGQADALRRDLGAQDRRKLDEYLESVRAIEKRIEQDEKDTRSAGADDPRFAAFRSEVDGRITAFDEKRTVMEDTWHARKHRDPTEQTRLMLDILALAFWSDATRASTFMFSNDVSSRNFSFVEGVNGSHHEMSHHEGRAEKLEAYARINRWHIEQWGYFLQRLKDIPEGDGKSLLDRSMVVFASSIKDGNAHAPHDLPVLLAGGGTRGGRILASAPDTPLANLYLSMLQAGGLDTPRFADSTGVLPLGG